jgi:hypothetical protein
MSHVRNLFHKPPGIHSNPAAASATAVSENVATFGNISEATGNVSTAGSYPPGVSS